MNSKFVKTLLAALDKMEIPDKFRSILESFFQSYEATLARDGISAEFQLGLFLKLLELIQQQIENPYLFPPYHEAIRHPFDYYALGIDFLRPLVDQERSSLRGTKNLDRICALLAKGENVILLANHQAEVDPQALSILLEKSYASLGEKMIFVAGERVITDSLAVPFSMGRNLLCIYSKRYIDNPPEDKLKKQLHNKRTMQLMSELLSKGGKCIYVAPSGGRDRPNASGVVEVARFDPQSIEMFLLMARQAKRPTHFFPLALSTYEVLPPPETIQIELGEQRVTNRAAIHAAFGEEIDMEDFPGSDLKDKRERRDRRAEWICDLVKRDYAKICGGIS